MQQPRLIERVRSAARLRHLSLRTEQAYSDWVRRFVLFRRKRRPEEMGVGEVRQFLSHLAVEGRVSASTRNQALCVSRSGATRRHHASADSVQREVKRDIREAGVDEPRGFVRDFEVAVSRAEEKT